MKGKDRFYITYVCAFLLANLPLRAEQDMTTDSLSQIEVVAPLSRDVKLQELSPVAYTHLKMRDIEKLRVMDVKDLTAAVPNLYIPDYGSRMTSSVYIRGLGSRIDQPAMGVYVDGIPLFNKNAFDYSLVDVRSILVLRGPQNTLYGRNAMGGVMDIKTLSPLSYQGTRVRVEGGSAQTWNGKLSTYQSLSEHFGFSLTAYGNRSNGYYTNAYRHDYADWSENAGAMIRLEGRSRNGFHHWNLVSATDWVNQGGFPYRRLEEGTDILLPVSYNDPCGYDRLTTRIGFSADGHWKRYRYAWSTSYLFLRDAMGMDQDFTPRSLFTLQQKQREHSFNQDITLRSSNEQARWTWLTGLNYWFRYLTASAPVLFKNEGIQQLILQPANAGIQSIFPNDTLTLLDSQLPIESDFLQRATGISLYHHSVWKLNDVWKLNFGARVEYEKQWFEYHSGGMLPYYISSPDGDIRRSPQVRLDGTQTADFFHWSPKLSLIRTYGANTCNLSLSRGFKSGGFNTQLFSDLIKDKMSAEIMNHYFTVPNDANVRNTIHYKPEYSWNVEAGHRYESDWCRVKTTLFYTDCRNQQLTIFPPGMQTGRMMANAGHSRIYGLECEASGQWARLNWQASYGYTHAVFADYPSGDANYRGKTIPYVPAHTALLGGDWNIPLQSEHWQLTLHSDVQVLGPLYWDEENAVKQKAYARLNASARLSNGAFKFTLWGKNLTNTTYSTFYFVSMKNRFLQQGKPLQWGVTCGWDF